MTYTKNSAIKIAELKTPLGEMIAIADDCGLYTLDFADRFHKRLKTAVIPGETPIIKQIKQELKDYFSGKNLLFKTPMHIIGSDFQKNVWQTLQQIPLGETRSYLEIAKNINYPTACQAVARAMMIGISYVLI